MLDALSSRCFVPAHIWYMAVTTVAASPITSPLMLDATCASVTVAAPTPRQTSVTEATTRGGGTLR